MGCVAAIYTGSCCKDVWYISVGYLCTQTVSWPYTQAAVVKRCSTFLLDICSHRLCRSHIYIDTGSCCNDCGTFLSDTCAHRPRPSHIHRGNCLRKCVPLCWTASPSRLCPQCSPAGSHAGTAGVSHAAQRQLLGRRLRWRHFLLVEGSQHMGESPSVSALWSASSC